MIQKFASIIQGKKTLILSFPKISFIFARKKKKGQDRRNNSKSLIKESNLQRKNIELFNLL